MHKTDPVLNDSALRTTITLIGVGGTGSHVLDGLGRMNQALVMLGHNGLMVYAMDPDDVQPHNIGRQKFGWSDLSKNKAVQSIARCNRMYGTEWLYKDELWTGVDMSNIMITAVDNNATRLKMQGLFRNPSIKKHFHHGVAKDHKYWLDLGNDDRYGQVVLGGPGIKTSIELLGENNFPNIPAKDSCSMEESLSTQDLFINQSIATIGLNLIWSLFRYGKIDYNACFLNLRTGKMKSSLSTLEP